MAKYLAIDIGGTYIKYAILDESQQLVEKQKVKTPVNDDQAILKQVDALISETMKMYTICGVGISTAGIVDRDKGEIIYAGPTIKDYAGTAFKEVLEAKYSLPVHVENDVNAALLGECKKGGAKGENDVFCITLGTGIGGSYYHDGFIDGHFQKANSVGYLLYDKKTDTRYETRASTSALVRMINHALGGDVTPEILFAEAREGNGLYQEIIHTWACYIAEGLAQIILLVDPKVILIGGGVSKQGDFLLTPIKQQIEQFLPKAFLETELKIATLHNDAALFGAVFPFLKEEKRNVK